MKLTENFYLQEFVPPEIYSVFEGRSIWFIDMDLVKFIQYLRVYFGEPITINNWHIKGKFKNSGFRMPDCPEGSKLSQHKFKVAIDPKWKTIHPEEVRNYIRKNYSSIYQNYGITTIEQDTPTWVHVDKRFTGLNKLFEVPFK